MPRRQTCRFAWLGTVEYLRARAFQDMLLRQIQDDGAPDILLLLEHPHVYTRGRLSRDDHLLTSTADLTRAGAPVYETDRGGQITYHGPGQLVGYPIINLRRLGWGPLQYVRTLEQVIVETLSDFGVMAHTEEGLTGVWTARGKIAAIGVKISQGIAFHGFAINVNTDLSWYQHIVPCGITDRPVNSLATDLGEPADLEAVRYSLVYRFSKATGMEMAEATPELASNLSACQPVGLTH